MNGLQNQRRDLSDAMSNVRQYMGATSNAYETDVDAVIFRDPTGSRNHVG